MKLRRIVTGCAPNGTSVFLADEAAPRAHDFEHVPGFAAALVWGTTPLPVLRPGNHDPALELASWVPDVGGANLMVITFPPDTVMSSPSFDPVSAGAEYMAALPGLAEQFEIDNPGMHRTDTIDYGIVLDGEIWLELDDGKKTLVGRHDIVIQQGTRHAWRNRGNTPVTMLFVLIGAHRSGRESAQMRKE